MILRGPMEANFGTSAANSAGAMPSVTAAVSTRNRPAHAVPCAMSILQNEGLLELIFVDQSDGDETRRELSTISDPRLRYVSSDQRGVTNGRNLGLDLAQGEIVAFTDDDCRALPNWISSVARIFADDPDAMVVCGRVSVPADLHDGSFTTGFEPNEREWQGRFPPPQTDWGITANMSLRKSLIAKVGSFDPVLGAGAALKSGGEPDLLFRVLKAGLKIVNAKEVEVVHLGTRSPGEQAAGLWSNYGSGTAAAFLKHVRLGDLDAARICLQHLGLMGAGITKNVLLMRRPLGLRYAFAFLSGAVASFKYSIDRQQRMYVQP